MTDKALTDFTRVAPNSADTVLGEQNGLVKRFLVSDLAAGVALSAATGAGLVGFDATEVYAAGTVGAKLKQAIDVRDAPYSAAIDGATDDTAAINAAATALGGAGGGRLYVGPGTLVAGQIALPDNVHIVGAGQKATTIKLKAGANADIIVKSGAGIGAGLFDLTVDGNDANNTAGGVYWAGADAVRGPTLTIERVRITACRPSVGGAALGVTGAVVLTGNGWGVVRDVDIDQNQHAVGLIHRGSDWVFTKLFLGPNGATAGTQSMIIQGGAGNRFDHLYLGGNGGLEQLLFWGASRNLVTTLIADNSWQGAIRFADNGGNFSSNNILLGGQISSAGYQTDNTYDAVSFEDAASGNLLHGFCFLGLQANKARYYVKESGTASGNFVFNGSTDANYGTGFASWRTTSSGHFAVSGLLTMAAAPTEAGATFGATEQTLLNDIRTRLIALGIYR